MPVMEPASTPRWPSRAIIVSSVPLVLIAIGLIRVLVAESGGVADTSAEHAVFGIGLYLAVPCGLASIVTGVVSLSRSLLRKWVAVAAIVVGTLSVAAGVVSWIWYFMVTSFTAAFN